MALFWTHELEVGVEEIDVQHRELFERIERLVAACQGRRGAVELKPLLGFLLEYMDRHFRTEEELMLHADYPDRERHTGLHKEFYERLAGLANRLGSGEATPELLTELNIVAVDWLFDHDLLEDRDFGRFLAAGN